MSAPPCEILDSIRRHREAYEASHGEKATVVRLDPAAYRKLGEEMSRPEPVAAEGLAVIEVDEAEWLEVA